MASVESRQDPVGEAATPDAGRSAGVVHVPSGAQRPAGRAVPDTLTVLVYSDDITTRERVRQAVGRRPAAELPTIEYVECATHRAVVSTVDAGGVDVLILDGEAVPSGGMGICRQLKDEVYRCPPILVVTGRRDDAWLAAWSRADAAVPHPINGVALAPAVADLMRRRLDQLAGSQAS